MPRFGFRARLFAVTMASILVVVGAGYWYLRNATEAAMLESLERDLIVRVELIETSVNLEAGRARPSVEPGPQWDALADHLGAVAGARTTLLRAAVAATLNAASNNVDYTMTVAAIDAAVEAALASGNRATMLELAAKLDADNNVGCPLN